MFCRNKNQIKIGKKESIIEKGGTEEPQENWKRLRKQRNMRYDALLKYSEYYFSLHE